jgi:hypothetical protein
MFIRFSAAIRGEYELAERTQRGSIAGLAKEELGILFTEREALLYQRYFAGRVLDFTPKEILKLHRNYDKIALEIGQKNQSSGIGEVEKPNTEVLAEMRKRAMGEIPPTQEEIKRDRAIKEFEGMYPDDKTHFCYRVVLKPNEANDSYNLVVFSLDSKPDLVLEDPIDEQRLYDHLVALPGKLSEIMIREMTEDAA